MPVDHVKLPVSVEASRRFYSAAPAPLGYRLVHYAAFVLDPDGHDVEAVWHG